ncbi:F-box/LRR-repeat protein-like protein [Tanacetum coccineum]
MEDRLTNLLESLQLRIMSTLDAQCVVQTSVLSKSWHPLWKSVPILRLNSYDFENQFCKFDKFVEKHLDLWVDGVEGREWPVVLHGFVDSLISLRLQSDEDNEELVSRCPPFRDFKFDVGDFDRRPSESIMRTTEYLEFISDMKGYLLRVTHCER